MPPEGENKTPDRRKHRSPVDEMPKRTTPPILSRGRVVRKAALQDWSGPAKWGAAPSAPKRRTARRCACRLPCNAGKLYCA